jgi:hypothetical protein
MEVEELPEGLYLATSDELPGLVAQTREAAPFGDIFRSVKQETPEAVTYRRTGHQTTSGA